MEKSVPEKNAVESRFKPALLDIHTLKNKTFAVNTDKKIHWAVDLYNSWFDKHVNSDGHCDWCIFMSDLHCVGQLHVSSFCFALCHFITEIRRKDLKEYPGETLYQISLCLQFYLEKNGLSWKLIDSNQFVDFRNTLDNTMKSRAAQGIRG